MKLLLIAPLALLFVACENIATHSMGSVNVGTQTSLVDADDTTPTTDNKPAAPSSDDPDDAEKGSVCITWGKTVPGIPVRTKWEIKGVADAKLIAVSPLKFETHEDDYGIAEEVKFFGRTTTMNHRDGMRVDAPPGTRLRIHYHAEVIPLPANANDFEGDFEIAVGDFTPARAFVPGIHNPQELAIRVFPAIKDPNGLLQCPILHVVN